MPLFIAVEALNLRDIFLFLLDDVGISNRCRGILVTILFLPFMAPKTSLVVLVLFPSLILMDERLWVLAT